MLYRFIYLALFLCVLHLLAHSGKPATAGPIRAAKQSPEAGMNVASAQSPIYILGPGPLQFAH